MINSFESMLICPQKIDYVHISSNNWFFLAIVKKRRANHPDDAKVDGVGIAFKGRGESLGPSKIFSDGMY